jgi:hypothetical protein
MALDPYERISWRGVTANRRTVEMLEITELRGLMPLAPLRIPQGSYTTGVSASAGTHSGGGALDISVRDLTTAERDRVVRELRETSFAAWYRPYLAGVWPAHIHAIAIGDKEMSAAAAEQVVQYRNGQNGLANHGADNGPDVPIHVYRQDIDMSYYGPERWDAADFERLFRRWYAYGITDAVSDTAGDTMPFEDVVGNDRKRLYDTKALLNSTDAKVDEVLVELGKLVPPPVPPV